MIFSRTGFAVATLIAASAVAQVPRDLPPFELEHLTFNPAQQAGLLLNTGDMMPAHQFRASVIMHYQHNPLVLIDDRGEVGAVVAHRWTTHVMAAFGITRWLDIGLQVPIVVYQRGDTLTDVNAPQRASLGTPWVQARLGLLSQARDQGIDLGIGLGLGLPLGRADAFTRDPTVGFSPRLGVGRAFGIIRAGLEVGALIRGGNVLSPDATTVGDEVGSVMQLGVNLATTNEGVRGEINAIGWVPFTRTSSSLELLAGIRIPLGPLELFAMGGPGFGRTPGTPAYRVMAGLALAIPKGRCEEGSAYVPEECPDLDIDHDGILNGVDKCVGEPGVARLAGCPERDADEDGVADDQDQCPTGRGTRALAGCPDTDQDGIADNSDRCPALAGPKENGGCPWPDGDGDGIADRDDSCPKEAGASGNKGCPWPDTDGDGTLDKDDACVNEAGPAALKGCPVKDADKDTVPDDIDNCPNEKGDPANQGCPKAKKQLVVITREKLVIREKVYFDTGKATIKPKSFGLLNQVANILVSHPEIAHIVIEGHTDNSGSADLNRTLSQKRAESVRDYVVKKGVDAGRLAPKGYGPDRPADVNTTAAGRENNRRVEFTVGSIEKPEGTIQ